METLHPYELELSNETDTLQKQYKVVSSIILGQINDSRDLEDVIMGIQDMDCPIKLGLTTLQNNFYLKRTNIHDILNALLDKIHLIKNIYILLENETEIKCTQFKVCLYILKRAKEQNIDLNIVIRRYPLESCEYFFKRISAFKSIRKLTIKFKQRTFDEASIFYKLFESENSRISCVSLKMGIFMPNIVECLFSFSHKLNNIKIYTKLIAENISREVFQPLTSPDCTLTKLHFSAKHFRMWINCTNRLCAALEHNKSIVDLTLIGWRSTENTLFELFQRNTSIIYFAEYSIADFLKKGFNTPYYYPNERRSYIPDIDKIKNNSTLRLSISRPIYALNFIFERNNHNYKHRSLSLQQRAFLSLLFNYHIQDILKLPPILSQSLTHWYETNGKYWAKKLLLSDNNNRKRFRE